MECRSAEPEEYVRQQCGCRYRLIPKRNTRDKTRRKRGTGAGALWQSWQSEILTLDAALVSSDADFLTQTIRLQTQNEQVFILIFRILGSNFAGVWMSVRDYNEDVVR